LFFYLIFSFLFSGFYRFYIFFCCLYILYQYYAEKKGSTTHIQLIPNISKESHFIKIKPETNPTTKFENYLDDKWFVNLSSVTIPKEVQQLLQLGDRFALPTMNSNLHNTIIEIIKQTENNIINLKNICENDVRNRTIFGINKLYNSDKPMNHIDVLLENWLQNWFTKRFTKSHSNILFTRADKGNITVALDKNTARKWRLCYAIKTYTKLSRTILPRN